MNETIFRMLPLAKKGYNCSQIILLMALGTRGESNPQLIRAMAGLGFGAGSGKGSCGALTGGACLLGLYAGKGDDGEQESEQLMLMLAELNDWFAERVGRPYGGIECEKIVGDAAGQPATKQLCGELVAETYVKTMDILLTHGFDPTGG